MDLTVTEMPGQLYPAASQGRSGPGGCRRGGGTLPAADFVACLLSVLHRGPGTGGPGGEAPLFGPVFTGVDGVPPPGCAAEGPEAATQAHQHPSGAEVNTGVIPAGLNAKAEVPAGPAYPPTLSAVENLSPASGAVQASRPGAAVGAVPGVPGGGAAAGSPPAGTDYASQSYVLPNAAGADVPPSEPGGRPALPSVPVPERAASVPAEPDPQSFPGRSPEGARPPIPMPGTPGAEPLAREAQPSGHGAAENRPGGVSVQTGLSAAPSASLAVPNDVKSPGHAQSAGVWAETVPERAEPVRILPGEAPDDGLKSRPAAFRAEAATDRPGPDGAPQMVRPATPDRGVVHAPVFDRQVPAQGTGWSVPDVSPPGMHPPARAADPHPVARQLAEAVVHHVRQLQVKAGQAVRVSIALEPPELGRVTIKLTFGRQGLEALFYTADRSVKAVIEQALPQLREALARQEIDVGNTTVFLGHEEARDQAPRFYRGPWPGPVAPGEPAGEQLDNGRQVEPRRSGVDYLV
ncbi:MAG: flagellar hook-length control protein FliK [Bacillota bacterium]